MSGAQPHADEPQTEVSERPRIQKFGGKPRLRRALELFTHWVQGHTGEILWAFVFAVLVGYGFELYVKEAPPYKIYVVADADTDNETLEALNAEANKGDVEHIGRVPVRVQVEPLLASQTEIQKAEDLVQRSDTLLVIEHGRSQKVENSIRTYFGARPQVPVIATVATDDELLQPCQNKPAGNSASTASEDKTSCFAGSRLDANGRPEPFAPLLQLSPTNEVQGRSAVKFAILKGRRRFLVVLGNDPNDLSYTENMTRAYSAAIHAERAELMGVYRMNAPPSESEFRNSNPDCVLYAGGVGEAQTMFRLLSQMKLSSNDLMVIFSDSVIQSRGNDADLAAFAPAETRDLALPVLTPGDHAPLQHAARRVRIRPVKVRNSSSADSGLPVSFTYQTDATDYNVHANPYVDDAFSIALQLIRDLNEDGGDFEFRVKSILHLQSVNDARRNLVQIMRQNSSRRTWYASTTGAAPYVFDGHKQQGGMFHVWQVKSSARLGSEMEDVDNWHLPRRTGSHVARPERTSR